MKIKYIGLSLLLTSSLFANDNQKKENIIDISHKEVVNTLDENVEVLPNELQGIAKTFVKDIDKDGKNVNFNALFTHIGFDNYGDGTFQSWMQTTQLATVGVSFLPNTWKIDLSYSTEVGKDLFLASSASKEWEQEVNSYSGNYIVKESNINTQYFNFYMKPISITIGDFGFGYTSVEKQATIMAENGANIKVLDYININQNGAITFSNNYQYAQVNEKTIRYVMSYNIPQSNTWYDGFGVSYALANSNRTYVIKPTESIALKPDITSNIFTVGINKTLDEIDTGFSFKKLSVGMANNEVKYYDYDKLSMQSINSTTEIIDIEVIFMKKLKKNKEVYFSAQVYIQGDDNQNYSETILEIGMRF